MKEKNVYLLLVSATPFSELGVNTADKKVFTLQPAPTYYGIQQMIEKNRIIDSRSLKLFTLKTEAEIGNELEGLLNTLLKRHNQPGFIIVRENVKSPSSRKWVAMLKNYLSNLPKDEKWGLAKYGFFDLNQETVKLGKKGIVDNIVMEYSKCVPPLLLKKCLSTASKREPPALGADAVLCCQPDRFVFIFIKEMLLAGKTLDTSFVRMVVDIPFKNQSKVKVDRLVQGLVGRCCGVGKDSKEVFVVTDMTKVQAYLNWVNGIEAPILASCRAGRNPESVTQLITSKTSAYCDGGIPDGLIDPFDEDEEPEDDDDEDISYTPLKNEAVVFDIENDMSAGIDALKLSKEENEKTMNKTAKQIDKAGAKIKIQFDEK